MGVMLELLKIVSPGTMLELKPGIPGAVATESLGSWGVGGITSPVIGSITGSWGAGTRVSIGGLKEVPESGIPWGFEAVASSEQDEKNAPMAHSERRMIFLFTRDL